MTEKHHNATHGMTGTPTFISWARMRDRCYNRNNNRYKNYGGRGISVCKRWRDSFEAFYDDMGARPDGCQIDRIDNDGDYRPENCRWVTCSQNCENKSTNAYLEYNGERLTISQWARRIGLNYFTLCSRLKQGGWTIEQALTIKVGGSIQKKEPITHEHNGLRLNVKQWSLRVGLSECTIKRRLKRGWTLQETLETPFNKPRI